MSLFQSCPPSSVSRCTRNTRLHLFSRPFTSSRIHLNRQQSHYEVLGLSSDASQGDIKKKFYTLSKAAHPDLHPSDPTASEKFISLSQAYNVLSNPTSRSKYDLTLSSPPPSPINTYGHRGSFSSHENIHQKGARSASGLSRRQSQFAGPPESFFKNGAWGKYTWRQSMTKEREGGLEDDDVPHFDKKGHYRILRGVERNKHHLRTNHTARSGNEAGGLSKENGLGGERGKEEEIYYRGGTTIGFFVVSSVLGIVFAVGIALGSPSSDTSSRARRINGGSVT